MKRLAPIAIAALLLPGCTEKTKPTDGSLSSDAPQEGRPRPKPADAAPDLVRAVEMESIGDRPGYLPDGLLYVSGRVGELQRYWDSIPKPSELERDGRDAVGEVGFNPVADNWAQHFHVAPDAVISATILRPLDKDIAAIRRSIDAIEKGSGSGSDGTRLGMASAALGYHTRVHVPSAAPDKTRAAMIATLPQRDRERGGQACESLLGPAVEAASCVVSSGGGVVALRELRDAVIVDLVIFARSDSMLREAGAVELSPEAETPTLMTIPARLGAAKDALAVESAALPNAAALSGDAAMWIEAPVLARIAAIDKLDTAIESLRYEGVEALRSSLERLERIEGLLEAPRLFPGVGVSMDYVDDDLYAVAEWPVAGALWGRMAVRSVTTKASTVPVPKADALCRDAVACFRMQALPDPRPIAKRLLAGGFAKDFEEVARALGRDEEYTMTLLFAGAWPNLLAAAVEVPESYNGPQAGVMRTARDAVMRTDGFGGALRSYRVEGFLNITADYAVYARASKQDIDAAKGLLSLSGQSVKDVELPSGKGRATTLQLDDHPPTHAFFQVRDGDFGWASLASDGAAFATVLGLEQETPSGPMAYVGFPDLWRLVAPFAEGDRESEVFRSWATARTLQFVLELDNGQPRIRASLRKQR